MRTYRGLIRETRSFYMEWDESDDPDEAIDRERYLLETAWSYPDTDWIREDIQIEIEPV